MCRLTNYTASYIPIYHNLNCTESLQLNISELLATDCNLIRVNCACCFIDSCIKLQESASGAPKRDFELEICVLQIEGHIGVENLECKV